MFPARCASLKEHAPNGGAERLLTRGINNRSWQEHSAGPHPQHWHGAASADAAGTGTVKTPYGQSSLPAHISGSKSGSPYRGVAGPDGPGFAVNGGPVECGWDGVEIALLPEAGIKMWTRKASEYQRSHTWDEKQATQVLPHGGAKLGVHPEYAPGPNRHCMGRAWSVGSSGEAIEVSRSMTFDSKMGRRLMSPGPHPAVARSPTVGTCGNIPMLSPDVERSYTSDRSYGNSLARGVSIGSSHSTGSDFGSANFRSPALDSSSSLGRSPQGYPQAADAPSVGRSLTMAPRWGSAMLGDPLASRSWTWDRRHSLLGADLPILGSVSEEDMGDGSFQRAPDEVPQMRGSSSGSMGRSESVFQAYGGGYFGQSLRVVDWREDPYWEKRGSASRGEADKQLGGVNRHGWGPVEDLSVNSALQARNRLQAMAAGMSGTRALSSSSSSRGSAAEERQLAFASGRNRCESTVPPDVSSTAPGMPMVSRDVPVFGCDATGPGERSTAARGTLVGMGEPASSDGVKARGEIEQSSKSKGSKQISHSAVTQPRLDRSESRKEEKGRGKSSSPPEQQQPQKVLRKCLSQKEGKTLNRTDSKKEKGGQASGKKSGAEETGRRLSRSISQKEDKGKGLRKSQPRKEEAAAGKSNQGSSKASAEQPHHGSSKAAAETPGEAKVAPIMDGVKAEQGRSGQTGSVGRRSKEQQQQASKEQQQQASKEQQQQQGSKGQQQQGSKEQQQQGSKGQRWRTERSFSFQARGGRETCRAPDKGRAGEPVSPGTASTGCSFWTSPVEEGKGLESGNGVGKVKPQEGSGKSKGRNGTKEQAKEQGQQDGREDGKEGCREKGQGQGQGTKSRGLLRSLSQKREGGEEGGGRVRVKGVLDLRRTLKHSREGLGSFKLYVHSGSQNGAAGAQGKAKASGQQGQGKEALTAAEGSRKRVPKPGSPETMSFKEVPLGQAAEGEQVTWHQPSGAAAGPAQGGGKGGAKGSNIKALFGRGSGAQSQTQTSAQQQGQEKGRQQKDGHPAQPQGDTRLFSMPRSTRSNKVTGSPLAEAYGCAGARYDNEPMAELGPVRSKTMSGRLTRLHEALEDELEPAELRSSATVKLGSTMGGLEEEGTASPKRVTFCEVVRVRTMS